MVPRNKEIFGGLKVDFYRNMSHQQRKTVSFSQKHNTTSSAFAFTGLFDDLQKIDEQESHVESPETKQNQDRREGHVLKWATLFQLQYTYYCMQWRADVEFRVTTKLPYMIITNLGRGIALFMIYFDLLYD